MLLELLSLRCLITNVLDCALVDTREGRVLASTAIHAEKIGFKGERTDRGEWMRGWAV